MEKKKYEPDLSGSPRPHSGSTKTVCLSLVTFEVKSNG